MSTEIQKSLLWALRELVWAKNHLKGQEHLQHTIGELRDKLADLQSTSLEIPSLCLSAHQRYGVCTRSPHPLVEAHSNDDYGWSFT